MVLSIELFVVTLQVLFFFFQAEDGIRYIGVTGVQTCALPISEKNPGNPFLQYAAAWAAGRGGHLETAEALYRRTLELWPRDDRALNNLGNEIGRASCRERG